MFIMGVIALGLGISLVQNGLSALDEVGEWGPFLIVGILFGLPFGHIIVRVFQCGNRPHGDRGQWNLMGQSE